MGLVGIVDRPGDVGGQREPARQRAVHRHARASRCVRASRARARTPGRPGRRSAARAAGIRHPVRPPPDPHGARRCATQALRARRDGAAPVRAARPRRSGGATARRVAVGGRRTGCPAASSSGCRRVPLPDRRAGPRGSRRRCRRCRPSTPTRDRHRARGAPPMPHLVRARGRCTRPPHRHRSPRRPLSCFDSSARWWRPSRAAPMGTGLHPGPARTARLRRSPRAGRVLHRSVDLDETSPWRHLIRRWMHRGHRGASLRPGVARFAQLMHEHPRPAAMRERRAVRDV